VANLKFDLTHLKRYVKNTIAPVQNIVNAFRPPTCQLDAITTIGSIAGETSVTVTATTAGEVFFVIRMFVVVVGLNFSHAVGAIFPFHPTILHAGHVTNDSVALKRTIN